jgi:hypothetical protein
MYAVNDITHVLITFLITITLISKNETKFESFLEWHSKDLEHNFGTFFDDNLINTYFTLYTKIILLILISISMKHWFRFININKAM